MGEGGVEEVLGFGFGVPSVVVDGFAGVLSRGDVAEVEEGVVV